MLGGLGEPIEEIAESDENRQDSVHEAIDAADKS